MNDIQNIIKQEVLKIVHETTETLALEDLKESDDLSENLGLQSIDWARLLAILEIKLDLNPFAQMMSVTDVRTLGDFINAYVKAQTSNNQETESATDEILRESANRATLRRHAGLLQKNRKITIDKNN